MSDPFRIDETRLTETLARLVRIKSVNPAFERNARGEAEIGAFVESELERLGMATARFEPEPNRVSVVGTLRSSRRRSGKGRSLMLYAHYDTVGVDGMDDPYSGRIDGGRMYGRGVYDMKAGLAACLAALQALRDAGVVLSGDVVLAAVSDEEVASIGIQNVLGQVRTDAAIVTEPTELQLCLAHKGFTWIEVVTQGRAAHGSRFDEGLDANMRMGRFLARLDTLEQELRRRPPHPLVGPPSLHAAVLNGGSGTSTYAASCRLEIERRTIPGETTAAVLAEVRRIVEDLGREDSTFQASVASLLARDSFEAPQNALITRIVDEHAAGVLGRRVEQVGASYWMDAAFLAAAGIETVVIGPAGGGAHAAVEWVELSSVVDLAHILARTAAEYCA